MKKAMMFLAMMVAGMAMSAPVKSNVAGETIIRNGENLPYDAEVEYLESTGTQWIDTGVLWTSGDIVECSYGRRSVINNGQAYFGGCDTSSQKIIGYSNILNYSAPNETRRCINFLVSGYYQNEPWVSASWSNDKIFAVIWQAGKVSVQNASGAFVNYAISNTDFQCDRSILLCCGRNNSGGRTNSAKMMLAGFSVERNVNKILDLSAVRFTNENGQSEGAMYDRVTGQLFRNQGTGAFLIGPDKR